MADPSVQSGDSLLLGVRISFTVVLQNLIVAKFAERMSLNA